MDITKDLYSTSINIAAKDLIINSIKITLQIWILGNNIDFRLTMPLFGRGSSGGIFMYDITDYSSLRSIKDWLNAFRQGLLEDKRTIPIIMIGGKSDLHESRVVSQDKAKRIAQEHKLLKYYECSSKTDENIDKIFTFMTRAILKSEGYLIQRSNFKLRL